MDRRNARRGWRAIGGAVLGALALVALPSLPAHAARGDLDTTFGDGGRALAGVPSQWHTGYDVVLDPATGRLYVSGVGLADGLQQPYVAAFTDAGALDTTFGAGGIALTGVASAGEGNGFSAGTAVALSPDGSRVYLTAAAGAVAAGDGDFAGENFVAAFTATGELDDTFSSDGFAGTGLEASPSGGTAMDVDPGSGRIFVAANTMTDPGAFEAESYLAAFDTDGDLDAAFGAGGIYDADLDTGFRGSVGLAIDPAADRLYFVTATRGEPGLGVATVRALDLDGALDPAFGTAGVAPVGLAVSVYPRFGVAVDAARDRLYVSSYEQATSSYPFIAAFTASDGAVDADFGDAGVAEAPLPSTDYSGQPITVDPADGSIYLGAWSNAGVYPAHNYVAAFTVDGDLDLSFGVDGGRATTGTVSSGGSEHGVLVDPATRRLYYVHYAASGGSGGTAEIPVSTAVVTAFQLDAPEPPVVVDDVASVAHDRTLTVAAPGLLGNDTGAGGEDVAATPIVDGPTTEGGVVQLAADGSYTYTPPAGFVGTDTFDYVAVGQAGGTATGSVTVTVTNATPTIADAPTYTTPYGEALDVPAPGVLSGATDADGDPLTAVPVGGTGVGQSVTLAIAGTSAGGTVDLDPDGAFRYTPPAGFSGVDTFTFTVGDGIGSAGPFTAQITVADPPPASTTTTTSTTTPTSPSTPPPTAPPVTTVPPPAVTPDLPATGGGSLPLGAIGLLLAVGGAAITLATRRWPIRDR